MERHPSLTLAAVVLSALRAGSASGQDQNAAFTEKLMQDQCTFSTTGRNTYFVLEPGYQLVLEGREDDETSQLVITVLDATRTIGTVETRVVEERESVNGRVVEVSRNFFALCKETGTVYYFGEEVDMFNEKGEVGSHEGAWTAEGSNMAGVVMPGLILLGARYYQEIAPGVAMDRAEIISNDGTMKTPAGEFNGCLKTLESSGLDPKEKEFKYYAPGIGLIQEEAMQLVRYGVLKQ